MTPARSARRSSTRRPSPRRPSPRRRTVSPRQRTRRRMQRRRLRWRIGLSAAAVALVAGAAVMVPLGLAQDHAEYCAAEPQTFPAAGVSGWSGDQLENAAVIVRTAAALGFERDGQILGVMTAMGESSLHNIDHGDWETRGFTNPDGSRTTSIGLFQQQDWWGSVETRMDPAGAAALFYARLGRLEGWQRMPPSHAAHRVQVNTDRDYYARYLDDATAVVDALSGECPAAVG